MCDYCNKFNNFVSYTTPVGAECTCTFNEKQSVHKFLSWCMSTNPLTPVPPKDSINELLEQLSVTKYNDFSVNQNTDTSLNYTFIQDDFKCIDYDISNFEILEIGCGNQYTTNKLATLLNPKGVDINITTVDFKDRIPSVDYCEPLNSSSSGGAKITSSGGGTSPSSGGGPQLIRRSPGATSGGGFGVTGSGGPVSFGDAASGVTGSTSTGDGGVLFRRDEFSPRGLQTFADEFSPNYRAEGEDEGSASFSDEGSDELYPLTIVDCKYPLLPLKDETFNNVVLNNVFQFTPAHKYLLDECMRVLTKAGILYVHDTDCRTWQEARDLQVKHYISSHHDGNLAPMLGYYGAHSRRGIEEFLEKRNMRLIDTRIRPLNPYNTYFNTYIFN